MMRINKILCLFLLISTHFVVGMEIVNDSRVVFINKKGEQYRLSDFNLYKNSKLEELILPVVEKEITNVKMSVKDYFELLKQKNEPKKNPSTEKPIYHEQEALRHRLTNRHIQKQPKQLEKREKFTFNSSNSFSDYQFCFCVCCGITALIGFFLQFECYPPR